MNQDVNGLGKSLSCSLESWGKILPNTVLDTTLPELEKYGAHPGTTFSACGGGYIIVATLENIPDALKIKIRY